VHLVQGRPVKKLKNVRRRSPASSGERDCGRSGRAEAFTHSPGCALREAFLNANRQRNLIKYRQKQNFLQELYTLINSIPSESDGAHIADWFWVVMLAGQYVFSRTGSL
jgi:hypothetical protein